MKKILAVLMAVLMVASLAACGGNTSAPATEPAPAPAAANTTAPAAETTAPEQSLIDAAKAEAVRLAVEAGALPETVEIIEVEDVPLAYHPGNTCRVRVKAAGDLA